MTLTRTLCAAAALIALAGAQAAEPARPTTTAQVNALLRVLKADGKTVIGQAAVASAGTAMATINVRAVDALVAANGRCAFNLRYDEVSNVAVAASTNRLYSNDTLVAQNTNIELKAGVLRSVTTQPYLYAGQNNLKVVLDAESASPTTGWVRINVDGTCQAPGAASAPKPAVTPAPAPAPAPAVRTIQPGSGDWNNLYNAWGYSNYATNQLKSKGYARYADLVKLNADLTAAVKSGKVEATAYAALIARWNAIASDADFKRLMAAVVPAQGK